MFMGGYAAYYANGYITISGGTFRGDVYGGYSPIYVAKSSTIVINGGTFEGNIYGGYAPAEDGDTSNTIVISGGIFATDTELFGAIIGGSVANGYNNTLVINTKGVGVKSVGGFEKYTFNVPTNIASNSMLRITGDTALVIANTDTLTVNLGAWSTVPTSAITLIDSTPGFGSTDIGNVTVKKVVKGNNEYNGNFVISDGTGSQQLLKVTVGALTKYVDVIPDAIANNTVVVTGGTTATINGAAAPAFNPAGGSETVWQNVYGGYSKAAGVVVKNNTVTVQDTGTANAIYGGYIDNGCGSATNNKVIIDSGFSGKISGDGTYGSIFGAHIYSEDGAVNAGSADNNLVEICAGSTVAADGIIGAVAGTFEKESFNYCTYSASHNTVRIKGSASSQGHGGLQAAVAGGIVLENGDACDNVVEIEQGTYTGGSILGGYVNNGVGKADGNIVNITGGTGTDDEGYPYVYGGWATREGSTACNNTVNIGGSFSGGLTNVCGGWGGTASGNKVTIDSDINGTSVIGGWAYYEDATNNEIKISGGTYDGEIYGGKAYSGNVDNNKVTISGGTYSCDIYGGQIYGSGSTGNANNNEVTISDGNFEQDVYGGKVWGTDSTSNASNNKVTINGGVKFNNIYGGYVDEGRGNVQNNIVVISAGDTFNKIYGGYIAQGSGNAQYNTVSITGGTTFKGKIYGGYSYGGNAQYNTVTITGGTTFKKDIYGGYVSVGSGNAQYNTVTITGGGTFEDPIRGGYISDGSGSVINNTVIINNGNFTADIYGGYANNEGGNAENNTVIINGGTFSDKVDIYGGKSGSDGGTSSGNTLVIGCKDISVNSVNDFQNYTFKVPAGVATDGSESMLKIMGDTDLSLDGLTINVDLSKSMANKGDIFALVEMSSAKVTGLATATKNVYGTDGIINYAGEIRGEDGNDNDGFEKVVVEADITGLNPDGSKAPVEGMAAAANLTNSSSDLAVGVGMASLITSTSAAVSNTETFGAANIGKARYNTGSHVDAKGYGIVAGVGKKVFDNKGNKTTGGLFFEYGNSDFDTYNNAVTGSGKGIYKGGGYMMRWDNKSGNYYEGMLHAGKVTTSWSNSTGGYNIAPTYYGGAVTYGHKFMVGEDRQLSVYGGYIYNHTGGGDAKIGTYDYNFEATNSHRTKVGVRYAMSDLMDTKRFRPYIGLAWEHEFNGESVATVMGFGRTMAPSMKGDTGILELGFKQEVGKWNLGIGAEVFTGKRRGWNGTLQAEYSF